METRREDDIASVSLNVYESVNTNLTRKAFGILVEEVPASTTCPGNKSRREPFCASFSARERGTYKLYCFY
jgi:hypothetical protein